MHQSSSSIIQDYEEGMIIGMHVGIQHFIGEFNAVINGELPWSAFRFRTITQKDRWNVESVRQFDSLVTHYKELIETNKILKEQNQYLMQQHKTKTIMTFSNRLKKETK